MRMFIVRPGEFVSYRCARVRPQCVIMWSTWTVGEKGCNKDWRNGQCLPGEH